MKRTKKSSPIPMAFSCDLVVYHFVRVFLSLWVLRAELGLDRISS